MNLQLQYGWHDLVGNLGVLCVLSTYFLLQAGRLRADDLRYGALNAFDFNLSSFVIELCWFSISVYGMARILNSRRGKAF